MFNSTTIEKEYYTILHKSQVYVLEKLKVLFEEVLIIDTFNDYGLCIVLSEEKYSKKEIYISEFSLLENMINYSKFLCGKFFPEMINEVYFTKINLFIKEYTNIENIFNLKFSFFNEEINISNIDNKIKELNDKIHLLA